MDSRRSSATNPMKVGPEKQWKKPGKKGRVLGGYGSCQEDIFICCEGQEVFTYSSAHPQGFLGTPLLG